jgi:hypothetical protein
MTLIGATYRGNGLIRRLRGLIVWILTPLDLVFMPLNIITLFGLPTIGEMLCLSPLKVSNPSKAMLYSLFLHPFLIAAPLLAPFALDEAFIDRNLVITPTPITNKLDKNLKIQWYPLGESYFLPTTLNEKIMSFPEFNKQKELEVHFISPNQKSKNVAAKIGPFQLTAEFKDSILKRATQMNPFLKLLVEDASFATLLLDSFTLSTDTIIDRAIKYGPLVASLLYVRKDVFIELGQLEMPDLKQLQTPAGEVIFSLPKNLAEKNFSYLIVQGKNGLDFFKISYPNTASSIINQLEKVSISNITKKAPTTNSGFYKMLKGKPELTEISQALKDWKLIANSVPLNLAPDARISEFKNFSKSLAPVFKRFKSENKKMTKEDKDNITQFEKYLK